MSDCTHDCSSCSSNCGERTQPQSFLVKTNPLASNGKGIAVIRYY